MLKIDRSFTRDIDVSPRAAALVEAILVMGAALDLKVVAEGIERPAQVERLRQAGCTLGQGYLFGRPQPLPDAGPGAAPRRTWSATVTTGPPVQPSARLSAATRRGCPAGPAGLPWLTYGDVTVNGPSPRRTSPEAP